MNAKRVAGTARRGQGFGDSSSFARSQILRDRVQQCARELPGDDSSRVHRGDRFNEGSDGRQVAHDARNQHKAPNIGKREASGRSTMPREPRHRG